MLQTGTQTEDIRTRRRRIMDSEDDEWNSDRQALAEALHDVNRLPPVDEVIERIESLDDGRPDRSPPAVPDPVVPPIAGDEMELVHAAPIPYRRPTTRLGRQQEGLQRFRGGQIRCVSSLRQDVQDAIAAAYGDRTNETFDLLVRKELEASAIAVLQNERPTAMASIKERFLRSHCFCLVSLLNALPIFLSIRHPETFRKAKYRGKPDHSARNLFLLDQLFDPRGNQMFCGLCVEAAFGIDTHRHSKIHAAAIQRASKAGVEVVPRQHVTPDQLFRVVVPEAATINETVLVWWQEARPALPVHLRLGIYNGNRGRKPGNAYVPEIVSFFVQFVNDQSQPSGREAGSGRPLRFFDAVFRRFSLYTAKELGQGHDPDASVVMAFQKHMADQGIRGSIPAQTTLHRWFQALCKGVVIKPHFSDYCDSCAQIKLSILSEQSTSRRVKEAGGDPSDALAAIDRLEAQRVQHLAKARQEREAYNASIARPLTVTAEVVVSIDYQQERTLPHFGERPQPGQTFFKAKLVVHLFGICCHHGLPPGTPDSWVYLTSEDEGGAKTADSLLTYLDLFLANAAIPQRTRLVVWGDNAATIKSRYLCHWATEQVRSGRLQEVQCSFMVPGHTKFAPDRLFSSLSAKFRPRDIFNVDQLASACLTALDPGRMAVAEVRAPELKRWREALDSRYGKVIGIREERWLRASRDAEGTLQLLRNGSSLMGEQGARRCTFTEEEPLQPVVGVEYANFKDIKLAELKEVYEKYVPREHWPRFMLNPPLPRSDTNMTS